MCGMRAGTVNGRWCYHETRVLLHRHLLSDVVCPAGQLVATVPKDTEKPPIRALSGETAFPFKGPLPRKGWGTQACPKMPTLIIAAMQHSIVLL